ncbi:Bifunctional polymyxin resistance protein ArnA [Andreprevotia sp. IGB-42]|uniref:formyltransferase n=1 Tax=Andreprevotia sp. IGB-42 TaxID=2497473 RepID=UPI00135690D6|nr:formyltransferase [Andreprevotia sp. IGB-42]KAF0815470.1 Bifunctional polymyxin resistance protein ArnA [Andreprevotia sp. IGB-42]
MSSAVVFAYHNVGVRCLKVLLAQGVDVQLVVTHEDNPGENIWFASVAQTCRDYGIPFITPTNPNTPEIEQRIAALKPDFLFSFYYRNMLGAALLAAPLHGAFNMHGSLLPRYRGRVPINWAVIHGETETGATLHVMNIKPDNGPIVDQHAVPILPDDTAQEVFDKVLVAAEICLQRSLPALLAGTARFTPQDLSQGAYFGGRKAEDGRLDWQQSAAQIHNLVRAVTIPYPGAFCDLAGTRLTIWRTLHADAPPGLPTGTTPVLWAAAGSLWLRAGDGGCLKVLAASWNDAPLDTGRFDELLGRHPLALQQS